MINRLNKKNLLLLILLCLNISILFLYAYIHIINVDEREHLYASYLVHNGYLPYRDFFEHHHPLLWYTFAPFLHFFDNTPYIWYIIRTFSLVLIFGCAYLVYKITNLLSENKITAFTAAIFYTGFDIIHYSGTEFRPDNLMILLFLSGLYYYFKYDKQKKCIFLALSYTLFFLSFFALQKNLFMLIALGIMMIYSTIKEKQPYRPIFLALLLPLGLTACYIFYLYHNHALKDYFELNWLIYLYRKIDYSYIDWERCIIPVIGMICIFLPNTKKIPHINIINILYITELTKLLLFDTSSGQHLLTLYPFLAIILATFLYQYKEKYQTIILITLIFTNAYAAYYIYNYPLVRVKRFTYLSTITLNNTDKNDLIVPDMLWIGGLRKSALGYYWFGLEGIARIDYQIFHRQAFPDLNSIIHYSKPKIISNMSIRNCLNDQNHITLDCSNEQTINIEMLSGRYMQSELMFLKID